MIISRLRIKGRLALGFGILLILMSAIVMTAVISGNQATFAVSEMNRLTSNVHSLDEALLWLRQGRALTWYYIATGDAKALDGRLDADRHFAETFADLKTRIKLPSVRGCPEIKLSDISLL